MAIQISFVRVFPQSVRCWESAILHARGLIRRKGGAAMVVLPGAHCAQRKFFRAVRSCVE